MPKNKMEDLRNHLFETLERLKDDDDLAMDIHKAEAIGKVAQTIIDSAKVEVDFLRVTGIGESSFFSDHKKGLVDIPKQEKIKTTKAIPVANTSSASVDYLGSSNEDLCLNCSLPECNENSPSCPIRIKKSQAKLIGLKSETEVSD